MQKKGRELAEEIVAAIRSDKTLAKHIIDYTWISGENTEVHPITVWARTICIQVDTHKNVFEKCIKRIIERYDHLFKDGYFSKNDDSCPAEVEFVYNDEVKAALQQTD